MTSAAAKRLLVLGTLATFLGGGRLAFDEVELANQRARVGTLEARASEAEADRKLVVRLERDLHTAESERDAAGKQLASIAQEAREGLSEQRKVTTQLAADLAAAAAALETKAEEAEAREAELARERAGHESARKRATALEAERDAVRAKAAEETRRREASETDLALTAERLRAVETVADERRVVLDKLRGAGVNVARLSGKRPMPRISAVIVRVDLDAHPLEVLVDAGSSTGLEPGDRLYVTRERREIACLEVVEVGEHIASTRLVRGIRGLNLKAGDDVGSRPADPQVRGP